MLGILAYWLRARDLDPSEPFFYGTLVLALASAGLFLWCGTLWWKGRRDPAKLAEAETRIRPVLWGASLAGGTVLLLLAVWLTVLKKMDAFAEISSLVVMGLICLGAAYSLRLTPQSPLSRQRLFEKMLSIRSELAMGLLIVGGLLVVLGIYFLFFYTSGGEDAVRGLKGFRRNYPGGPEGLGLILIGLVLMGGGLYQRLTLDKPATVDSMRMLVLYCGSLTGFIIALFTAVRVAAWWSKYFDAITKWYGEDGWRFWACAYLALFGLVLLFGSLLLARVDIRQSAPMRRLLYGYSTFLSGLLLLALLIVTNIAVATTFTSNVEYTDTGLRDLHQSTKDALLALKNKVTVWVLMPRYVPPWQEVRDLMDNCESVTDMIEVHYVSPDQDAGTYKELAQVYKELEQQTKGRMGRGGDSGRGLLVVYDQPGRSKKDPLHIFIPENDLEGMGEMDFQTGGGGKRQFKGEVVLLQAIQQLAENKVKPKIYFTQLSGEPFITPIVRDSVDFTVSKLRKDNFDVMGLVWDYRLPQFLQPGQVATSKKSPADKHAVPSDCRVLVICGADKAFSKEVLAAIDEYIRGGGKIMVMTLLNIGQNGKVIDDATAELCKKLNVEVGNEGIMHFADRLRDVLRVEADVPAAAANKRHLDKVAKTFSSSKFTLLRPRPVKPLREAADFRPESILEVSPFNKANSEGLWTETDFSAFQRDPLGYPATLKRDRLRMATEPISVGVAVTDKDDRPRAMVLGDYSIIHDEIQLGQEDPRKDTYYNYFRTSLEWLAERKVIIGGIPPRESRTYTLEKDKVDKDRILTFGPPRVVWLPLGLVIVALAGMGAGLWVVRRK
jgi:hypothetical protein